MPIRTNPLLSDAVTPPFDTIAAEHVVPAVTEAIARHRAALDEIRHLSGFAPVFVAKAHADAALSLVWQTVNHLHAVRSTPDLRAAFVEAETAISAHWVNVGQDRDLYQAIRAIPLDGLPASDRRAVALAIEAFEHAGVGLDDQARARFAAVSVESAALSSGFANAVMDATEAWTLTLTDPARLAGVPEPDMAAMARKAAASGQTGWTIDLHAASVRAITTFAEDRALRRTVYEAFGTRASDQGPHAGQFDNSDRIVRLMALRQEAARLIGYADPAAFSLATKMARDADEVEAFLLDLARRARPRAEAELADLTAFARDTLGIATLEPWDMAFATERLRLARHALDDAAIKRHLPLSRALTGLFALIKDLFDVEVRPGISVPIWHPDVRYFEFYHPQSPTPFAAVFCDFFSRESKRGGAWMDVCRPRLRHGDGSLDRPIAQVVCNFGAPAAGGEAYLSHDDLQTLFHEMGHCLHHVLTGVDLPAIGGVEGVEWDAVELPSQFLENFAWEPAVLRGISAHAETGAVLHDMTIQQMIEARQFMGGMALLRQVEFSLFDLRLHRDTVAPAIRDVQNVLHAVRFEVAVTQPPTWHRFFHAFAHVFAGGYAAGYYSYLRAERLSADAFEAFVEEGADRGILGARFRDEVLARGGGRSANENFFAFRARHSETKPLLRARGLA